MERGKRGSRSVFEYSGRARGGTENAQKAIVVEPQDALAPKRSGFIHIDDELGNSRVVHIQVGIVSAGWIGSVRSAVQTWTAHLSWYVGDLEMNAMSYSLVKEVNEGAQNWSIRTRVARIWEQREYGKSGAILKLHMVLVDEKGDGIYAFVPQALVPKFKATLEERQVYHLKYFETNLAIRKYRPVFHNCELRFTSWTRVTPIGPVRDDFPLYAYTLRSFKDILDTLVDKIYLADITILDVRGTPTPKRNLRITDGRHTAITALWGDHAGEIDEKDLMHRSQREPIILLAVGCTFKMQDSMLCLTRSFGSRIYINPPTAEISAFRNRIIGIDYSIEWIAERGRRLGTATVQDTSVEHLAALIPNEAMNQVFRCKIKVKAIASDQNWWFRSCDQCSYRAVEDADAFCCTGKDCTCRSASPRYKVGIKESDGNAEVNMIFIGDVAKDLIGKPADVLVNEFLASNLAVPLDISRLVGRNYVVEVAVSRFSFRRDKIDFQVLKFYTEGGAVYADFGVGTSSSFVDQSGSQLNIQSVDIPKSPGVLLNQNLAVSSIAQDLHTEVPSPLDPEASGKLLSIGEEMMKTPESIQPGNDQVDETTPQGDVLDSTYESVSKDDVTDNAVVLETQRKKRSRGQGGKTSTSKKLFAEGSESPSAGYHV